MLMLTMVPREQARGVLYSMSTEDKQSNGVLMIPMMISGMIYPTAWPLYSPCEPDNSVQTNSYMFFSVPLLRTAIEINLCGLNFPVMVTKHCDKQFAKKFA